MSSFYDDASLVVIPSGYKTSKVYSEKPTDGSGDLAFTRTGDTATRVNSAGLIEKVRTNLLTYSNTFSNAAWTKNNVTLTSGQADPNGGTEGTRVQFSGVSYMFQVPSTAFATASVYVRATSGTASIRIGDSNGNYVVAYNLTTAWQRITSFGSAMAGMSIDSYIGGSWTAQDVIVAFAQFETGDIATAYIPTTTAAVSVGPVANVPRLDYLGSTCPRLLLEPQRTNLKTYSEDFSAGAGWSTSTAGGSTVTYTANYGISPDGYQNADRLQLALNGGPYADYLSGNTITNGTTYTYSIYVKSLSGTVSFYFLGGTPAGNILKTATTEWTRITHTFTASSTVTYPRFLIEAGASSSVDLLIWGAQLEAGAYATSYIPTLAASATRGADACSKTGISSLIGQTQGTLFAEFVYSGKFGSASNSSMPISIDDASGNNEAYIFINGTNNVASGQFVVGGGFTCNISGLALTVGTRYKIAFAYKQNDFALYINGALQGVDTSGNIAALPNLRIGNYFGLNYIQDTVNQALLFKTRLTNAELAELTTL